MTLRHGSKSYLSVAGTDISTYLNSASFDTDLDNNDVTTFGDTWKANAPGVPGGTISLEGFYDPTTSTGPVAVLWTAFTGGASVAIVYRPGGTLAGQSQYAFSANITAFGLSGAADGMVALSAAFTATGTITLTTQ